MLSGPGPLSRETPYLASYCISGAQNLSGLRVFFRGDRPLLPSKSECSLRFNDRACPYKLWQPVVNVGAALAAARSARQIKIYLFDA